MPPEFSGPVEWGLGPPDHQDLFNGQLLKYLYFVGSVFERSSLTHFPKYVFCLGQIYAQFYYR